MNSLFPQLTALALLSACALSASAQMTTYCGGNLKVFTEYVTIESNGRTSQVHYHLQLQNQKGWSIKATTQIPAQVGNYRVQSPLSSVEFLPNEFKTVRVLTLGVSNPSGSGAPSAKSVAAEVQLHCPSR